ncbi:hypothetical protein PENFLA_c036G00394 [Penicillium flavigenum]|uniref:Uncharacterized protein n=1 Tax=Penicillium flavigenum TaxID=254877 RepID=A0A1V6SLZ0_9EURO|nr:hypothetical protein PENFLA_c036G00394 [Penicillium flavigenum]
MGIKLLKYTTIGNEFSQTAMF